MPATHHYDDATNTIVIENEDAVGEEYFYNGGDYGVEVNNLVDLACADVSGGCINCSFNGVSGRVMVWVVAPSCDCCAEWTGSWYIKLAAIRLT